MSGRGFLSIIRKKRRQAAVGGPRGPLRPMRFSFNRLHVNRAFGRGTENKTRSKMFHIKNILNRMMSSSPLKGMGFAALLLVSAPVSAQVSPNLGVAGT